jgi:hypothetical protein
MERGLEMLPRRMMTRERDIKTASDHIRAFTALFPALI